MYKGEYTIVNFNKHFDQWFDLNEAKRSIILSSWIMKIGIKSDLVWRHGEGLE